MTQVPHRLRADVVGGDAFGAGDQPALSWWLPEGATSQSAYRVVSDDGYDSGWVESDRQTFVVVPLFDRPRRRTSVRVAVRSDAGESGWSDPVVLDSGLLGEDDWGVPWIGVDEPSIAPKGERPAYWLRHVFDVDEPRPAWAHITALGLYEAWINGVRVGDAELAPGYTQYDRRVQYQTYDVGPLLRRGRNVVAVLLGDGWYRGQVGAPRAADQFGDRTALRLRLEDGAGELLVGTSENWTTSTSHILAADLIGGQREDRRLVDSSVHDARAAHDGWAQAVVRDVGTTIVRSVAPPVRRIEELVPQSVERLPNGAHVVDLGQNINGWIRLSSLGSAGTKITLRHGEHLAPDGSLTTAHLDVAFPILPEPLPLGQVDVVTSAGRDGDAFEPRFTTKGFRYVQLEGHPGPLAPDDLRGVVVHSDLRRTGWFECSDPRINALHEAVVWSLRDNVCDVPTDCPQRERAPWAGDWQVFAEPAAFLYDVDAFTRKWLRDLALAQRADGCVSNFAPTAPCEGFDGPLGRLHGSAGWGDAAVLVPWRMYEAYGDESLLRESWPSITRWLEFAVASAASGRHPARAAARPEAAPHEDLLWDTGFHWGEWLEPDAEVDDFPAFLASDKAEVATAYLHLSARTAAEIARIIGRTAEDVERWQRVADGARAAWQAEFVRDDGSLAVQRQASHVRALSFGLVPDELRRGIADRLAELVAEAGDHLTTGFLSTGLLLPVLAQNGHAEAAYRLLLQGSEPSWLTMLDRGATTVWERWNGVDADGAAQESLNHYSKGAVVSFLHRAVVGLVPTSPGYRTFRVQPRPGGGLSSASARLDSPLGPIGVSWLAGSDRFELQLVVPRGARADVVLPDGSEQAATCGSHAWSVPTP